MKEVHRNVVENFQEIWKTYFFQMMYKQANFLKLIIHTKIINEIKTWNDLEFGFVLTRNKVGIFLSQNMFFCTKLYKIIAVSSLLFIYYLHL